MQISFNGIKLIKDMEGFRSKAYVCPAGKWTIGYGTTTWMGKPVEAGMTMTEKEAELALQSDLAWAQTAVNKQVKVPLKQGMFDALVSFVYNIGESAFAKSILLCLLNLKQYEQAAAQFGRWVYAGKNVLPGLVRRRRLERTMFEESMK